MRRLERRGESTDRHSQTFSLPAFGAMICTSIRASRVLVHRGRSSIERSALSRLATHSSSRPWIDSGGRCRTCSTSHKCYVTALRAFACWTSAAVTSTRQLRWGRCCSRSWLRWRRWSMPSSANASSTRSVNVATPGRILGGAPGVSPTAKFAALCAWLKVVSRRRRARCRRRGLPRDTGEALRLLPPLPNRAAAQVGLRPRGAGGSPACRRCHGGRGDLPQAHGHPAPDDVHGADGRRRRVRLQVGNENLAPTGIGERSELGGRTAVHSPAWTELNFRQDRNPSIIPQDSRSFSWRIKWSAVDDPFLVKNKSTKRVMD